MVRDQCIVDQPPNWQLTTLRRTAYGTSRQYSAYASDLLQFFRLHRTATARQVQRVFADRFRSERSVRMHLQTLARKEELAVLRGENLTGPNVYAITGKGLGLVELRKTETRTRRRPSTGQHLVHELLITEFAVWLREEIRRRSSVHLLWQERIGLSQRESFRELVPDYGFLIEHPPGRLACFVEVSSGEESATRFEQKLQAYADWVETENARRFLVELYREHGAQQPRANFRCLWIMHNRLAGGDDVRLKQLLDAASKLPLMMRNRVWCTTAAALARVDAKPHIWLRLADVEPLVQEFQSRRSREWGQQLTRHLVSSPRYSLFPTVEIIR